MEQAMEPGAGTRSRRGSGYRVTGSPYRTSPPPVSTLGRSTRPQPWWAEHSFGHGEVSGENRRRRLRDGVQANWTSPPSSVYDELGKASGSFWMDTEFKSYSNRPTTMLFGPQFLKSRLYQLCSPEDVTLGTTLLRIGSLFIEDLKDQPPFSKNRYGSVNTVYIICAQDQAITVEYQRSMIVKSPVKEVKTIKNADHMAMLSTPEELSQYLMDIAEAYA
uniref:AB hydrolase-1 domain-containing protein n=1 Tax=Ananas comosus var. bracteatus TaxID=296719 RepID=A0A6V7QDM9_ANACO|nr:unnamed protein product [Ananas comosus var. bracteatus]